MVAGQENDCDCEMHDEERGQGTVRHTLAADKALVVIVILADLFKLSANQSRNVPKFRLLYLCHCHEARNNGLLVGRHGPHSVQQLQRLAWAVSAQVKQRMIKNTNLKSVWPKLKTHCWNVMNDAAGYKPSETSTVIGTQALTAQPVW